jgi:hypothetical protein
VARPSPWPTAVADDFSEFDRFSETLAFRLSLESGFEAAFWDASESFALESVVILRQEQQLDVPPVEATMGDGEATATTE